MGRAHLRLAVDVDKFFHSDAALVSKANESLE